MYKLIIFSFFISHAALASNSIDVSQSQFGDKWPLIVSNGTLKCTKSSVIFVTDSNKEYAVNGFAKSRGYLDITPIWKDDLSIYDIADEIRKPDETVEEVVKNLGGPLKVNIGPLLRKGLSLCD